MKSRVRTPPTEEWLIGCLSPLKLEASMSPLTLCHHEETHQMSIHLTSSIRQFLLTIGAGGRRGEEQCPFTRVEVGSNQSICHIGSRFD